MAAQSPTSRRGGGLLARLTTLACPIALAGVAGAALIATAGSASAEAPADSSSIEGVWSFHGGRVAVQEQPDGKFTGIVLDPIKFDECVHQVGEPMWKRIARQSDGSYWGFHQWFFENGTCARNPNLGQTAWRVLRTSTEGEFLRVCFSEPASGEQPTIGPAGDVADSTFGCFDSELISALPQPSFESFTELPSNSACVPGKLRIRIRNRTDDPLKSIRIVLRSGSVRRQAKVRAQGDRLYIGTLYLGGLPETPFTVTVRLTTVLGKHLSGRRTYTHCGKGRVQAGRHRNHRETHRLV